MAHLMIPCTVHNFQIGPKQPLAILSGPCVIESEEHTLTCAERLVEIFREFPQMNLVFKASYDKANRSAGSSFRGPGLEEGLRILAKVKALFNVPIVTDVHSVEEAKAAGEVVDIIQIPAFLCRQTDLIIAAAETGKAINVKKGQFMAPWDMKNVVDKILSCGNNNILLCERGASFGYNNLVSDPRSIPIMQELGHPVCFDATHSVQLPGGLGTSSGGQRQFVGLLAKVAITAGANALFLETHPNPASAKSDASTVLDLADLPALLRQVSQLYELAAC